MQACCRRSALGRKLSGRSVQALGGIAGGTAVHEARSPLARHALAIHFESGPGSHPKTSRDVHRHPVNARRVGFLKLLSRPLILQGHPRTSSSSHNFFGVRLGVSEIALSSYPTLEIRCKLRGLRDGRIAYAACYSNPGLGFELGHSSCCLLVLFALRRQQSRGRCTQPAARGRTSQRSPKFGECYLCTRNDVWSIPVT
jgi:hypothetical protein